MGLKRKLCAFVPLCELLLLTSCATTISFDVQHPPIVDLRGVKTITVIPFEWTGSGWHNLEDKVTAALRYDLRNTIRTGNIEYVDPEILKNIRERDFKNYVDVFITGKITGIYYYDSSPPPERRRRRDAPNSGRGYYENHNPRNPGRPGGNHDPRNPGRPPNFDGHRPPNYYGHRPPQDFYRTVSIEIEYSYIRASNGETLGQFKKTRSRYFEERNQWDTWSGNRIYFSDRAAAEEAAAQFTINSHEVAPWTSTEDRRVRGKSGADELNEAVKLIRRAYYGRAMGIYSDLYKSTNDKLAGYNLALMLQLDNKFNDALKLLEEIEIKAIQQGKRAPRYIKNEIETLKGVVKGLQVLEGYGE